MLGAFTIGLILSIWSTELTTAQSIVAVSIDRNEAWVDFPEAIDFRLVASTDEPIIGARLEYGVTGISCGEVNIQQSFDFEPDTDIDLEARWQVVPNDIIPPHANVWWRWTLISEDGRERSIETSSISFSDEWFVWREIERDQVFVHWYRGSQSFAEQILEDALVARDDLASETGLLIEEPIHAYLYEEGFDFQISLPGAPSWAGGVAFPEHNIVMVVTNPESINYGSRTIKHEVGHLVIGQLTFNCFQNLPTWLNEGLAQIAEGEPESWTDQMVQEAVETGTLPYLSQLEGSFSIHGDRASLSYAVSDQFTRYIIDSSGSSAMGDWLTLLKAGNPLDASFETIYGTTLIEVEDRWRLEVGATSDDRGRSISTESDATAIPTMALQPIQVSTPTPESTPTQLVPTETAILATETPIPTPVQEIASLPDASNDSSGVTIASEEGSNVNSDSRSISGIVWWMGGGALVVFSGIGFWLIQRRKSSETE